jgi:hypothetical protein
MCCVGTRCDRGCCEGSSKEARGEAVCASGGGDLEGKLEGREKESA